MKPRILLSSVLVPLLAAAATAQVERVSVADPGSPLAGASTVERLDVSPTLPEAADGGSVPQMPGWPVVIGAAGSFYPSRNLVFADLDGDGTQEIVTSSTDKRIYAWDHTGTPVPGFPVVTLGMAQYAPTVVDIEGDGDLEIVQLTRGVNNDGWLYVVEHDGTVRPGFPVGWNDNELQGSPTLADLDEDGVLEIIVPERDWPIGYLHVVRADGSEWGGNWPIQLDHVPATGSSVADLDGDGHLDVVYCSYDSLYVFDTSGNPHPGFPLQVANAKFSYQSPAIVDLDGDGDLEIVVGMHQSNAGCYAFHHDGTPVAGWPKLVSTWSFCPPTITDLEGDGELDVVFGQDGPIAGTGDAVFAWSAAGVAKPGFPYQPPHGGGSGGSFVAVDLDGDGTMEIFADQNISVGGKGFVLGLRSNGTPLPGFPLRPNGFTYMNGPTIGDVDGDGDLELGILSFHDGLVEVNLYDLPSAYEPARIDWGTYKAGDDRVGRYHDYPLLAASGGMATGSTLQLWVVEDPGESAFLWAAVTTGTLGIPPFGFLHLGLVPAPTSLLLAAVVPASGSVQKSVPIPADPTLAGIDVHFQGLTVDFAALTGGFTKLVSKVVQ